MNVEEFVNAVKLVVEQASVDGVMNTLQKPGGRKPPERSVSLSNWFNELSEKDKTFIKEVVELSVTMSVFGFFNVLDGSRATEGFGEKGTLELWFKTGKEVVLLNDINKEPLHDIYRGTLPD